MNDIESWLAEGNLNSDGRANEVVDLVFANPEAFGDVLACLESANPIVRGHTADALEKIGREHPAYFLPHIAALQQIAETDRVAMVQWHLAMLFGHLSLYPEHIETFTGTLLKLLHSNQLFTQSWAITSLAILATLHPDSREEIVKAIGPLERVANPALRKRASKALAVLVGEQPFPKGWVKSRFVQSRLDEIRNADPIQDKPST